MLMRRLMRVAVIAHVTSCLVFSACGSDASPSNEAGDGDGDGDGEPDAGADDDTDDDGAPDDDDGDDATPDDQGGDDPDGDDGGECLAKNGELTANGSATLSLTNGDANLDMPAPGSIDCQAQFEATGGVGTGALNVSCFGIADPHYYGFTLVVFATPTAGESYLIGSAASVSDGMGGYKSNEEVSFSYEEGPHCESKQGMLKQWDAQAAETALLTIDSLESGTLTFSLSATSFVAAAPGFNEQGTGGFQLSFTATATVAGL